MSLIFSEGGDNGSVFVVSSIVVDGVEVDRVIICRLVPDGSDGGWSVGEV